MLRMGSSVSSTGKTVQSMAQRIEATLETLFSLPNHGISAVSVDATNSTLFRFGARCLRGAVSRFAASRFAAASRLATTGRVSGSFGRNTRDDVSASEPATASRTNPSAIGACL